MQTRNLEISLHINESIKLGDSVYLIDGSSLALKTNNYNMYNKYNDNYSLYIVHAYEELTGSLE